MYYCRTILEDIIDVNNVITIYYYEFAKDYVFKGESHDFWEFVYVDKGEIEVMADVDGYRLTQGEVIFHKPMEFHNLWANGKTAPNLVIVSFHCDSVAMKFFENKILSVGNNEKKLIAQIVKEAREVFVMPIEGTSEKLEIVKKKNNSFGGEQLIKIYLQQLLINFVRQGKNITPESRLSSSVKQRYNEDTSKKIIQYLKENIYRNITFDDVCNYCNMGKTNVKVIFKETMGVGVIEYYRMLKIEEAKRIIREEQYNFTEIAERLCYSSIHNFSRHFKKATSMSPSEYVNSIKVII